MPYLIVPPTQIYADYQEISPSVRSQMLQYQNGLLSQFNLSTPKITVATGGFIGTKIYEWKNSQNVILLTSMAFEKGSGFQKPPISYASLIDRDACVHLGSVWSAPAGLRLPFALDPNSATLPQFLERKLPNISPVHLNVRAELKQPRWESLLKTVTLEMWTQKQIPMVSSVGTFYCEAQWEKSIEMTNPIKGKKPHRIVDLSVKERSEEQKPVLLEARLELHSGVFGQTQPPFQQAKNQVSFQMNKVTDDFVNNVTKNLVNLEEREFKILRRYGSWVYLNRGMAFGLKIGMRLVGPNKSTLHIIRYAPKLEGELDAAIAFIRHESKDIPLKEGDVIRLDPRVYP